MPTSSGSAYSKTIAQGASFKIVNIIVVTLLSYHSTVEKVIITQK